MTLTAQSLPELPELLALSDVEPDDVELPLSELLLSEELLELELVGALFLLGASAGGLWRRLRKSGERSLGLLHIAWNRCHCRDLSAESVADRAMDRNESGRGEFPQ